MRVAGFGFRMGVTEASLNDALARAGGVVGVTALATAEEKAEGLLALGLTLGLPVIGVPRGALAAQAVLTHSPRVETLYGTGSVAEAAALAAAGPGACLLAPRAQSADGSATAAIAERDSP
jgi:cobalt-precorrin 5A hydrolase